MNSISVLLHRKSGTMFTWQYRLLGDMHRLHRMLLSFALVLQLTFIKFTDHQKYITNDVQSLCHYEYAEWTRSSRHCDTVALTVEGTRECYQ